MPGQDVRSAAELVVEFLLGQRAGLRVRTAGRPYPADLGPLGQRKMRIIDVRDEGAAVHMAHAHAVLTGSLASPS